MTARYASSYTIVRVPLDTAEDEIQRLAPFHRYEFWQDGLPFGHHYTERHPIADAYGQAVAEARHAAIVRARTSPPAPVGVSTVSLIICTRDRPDDLARCLHSLRDQARAPDEVVVVDNAPSDDRTRAVAVAAGVRYVREDRPGLDHARNAGVQAAVGDLIVFTDDDVVLSAEWLSAMVRAFDKPEIQAVTGLVMPAELATRAQVLFERDWGFGRGYLRTDHVPEVLDDWSPSLFPAWSLGAGASMAFRREVFDVCGLFDLRLGAGASGCSDDSEMWYRILHHGGTCRYEPSVVAWHYHRRTTDALKRQLRAYMSGHLVAAFVQHERTGRPENLAYATRVLPQHYLKQFVKTVIRPWKHRDKHLFTQIRGLIDGWFYYRDRIDDTPPRPTRFAPAERATPTVSIVIPMYNAAATLEETIASAAAQSYPIEEIIVVDDGSKDQSRSVAEAMAAVDPRIRVLRQPNGGVARARNHGIQAAKSDYVAPLDADDLWHPDKITRQVAVAERLGPACSMVYSGHIVIDGRSQIIRRGKGSFPQGWVIPNLLFGNFIGNASSPLIRRADALACGGYDPSFRDRGEQGCEDLDIYLKLAERGLVGAVSKPDVGYREISVSMSSDTGQMLRGFDAVTAPFAERYAFGRTSVASGRIWLAMWLALRAWNFGRRDAALQLLSTAFRSDPLQALRAFRDVAPPFVRSAIRLRMARRDRPFARPTAEPSSTASPSTAGPS